MVIYICKSKSVSGLNLNLKQQCITKNNNVLLISQINHAHLQPRSEFKSCCEKPFNLLRNCVHCITLRLYIIVCKYINPLHVLLKYRYLKTQCYIHFYYILNSFYMYPCLEILHINAKIYAVSYFIIAPRRKVCKIVKF